MPVTPTYPGLYIEELPPTTRTITAAPTSIAVFVGHTHPFKTPESNFGKPVRIFSFTDYEREFGGLYRNNWLDSHVAYAVQQFFLNGGSVAYVVAIKPHYYTDASTPVQKPFAAAKFKQGSSPNFVLTAKEPVDSAFVMRVTISNLRKTGSVENDTADIVITYRSRAETFLGVKIGELQSRLSSSSLVSVTVTGTPTAFALESGTAFTYLAPDEAPGALWTTFSVAAFANVFATNGPLDKLEIFNLLVIPGVPGTQLGVWGAALSFCERKRAFAILDTTETAVADSPTAPALTADDEVLSAFSLHTNGACYFPYLRTVDALTGDAIELPPSGYVAGIYARTDNNRGVWKAPAGLETTVHNTTGVAERGRMTDGVAGVMNEAGVNALRMFPGVGTVVFGARTLVTKNPSFQHWRYVPVRRMALFLEQTLLRNLGWVVFEPNDEPLWVAIRTSVEAFMLWLFRQGAFQGKTPSQAFLVKCDSTTTTQDDIDNGRVNIVVGFSPLKPAEFVIIKIAQLAGQAQS